MKRKLYTRAHDIDYLKRIDNQGAQMSAQERSAMSKDIAIIDYGSKEALIRSYLLHNANKLQALSFLMEYCNQHSYTCILSLGAGPCVLEYFLSLALPKDATVVAADYDSYAIERAGEYFPEIKTLTYDFFHDDLEKNLKNNEINPVFDLVVFIGATFVMDDVQLIKVFQGLKSLGVKEIIDFHAGYMDVKSRFCYQIEPLRKNALLRKLLRRQPYPEYPGKFHGYTRCSRELKKLYSRTPYRLKQRLSLENYKFIAILG